MMLHRYFLFALLPVLTKAQFTCTFAASDEPSCLTATADDGSHCAWCALSAFGFCATEAQAQAMEQNLPNVHCDRYHGSDDDATNTDDHATNDDHVAPADDALPDDFWTCLQQKTATACRDKQCTWCDSKAGFGLCMTGPAAESAAQSDFFQCHEQQTQDPYDSSCILAYLQSETQQGCVSAVDQDGQPCEWCTLAGMTNLCLTQDQAVAGAALGINCETTALTLQDPYDTSCVLAFLQDPTQQGCVSALDQDGEACEWCNFQESVNLCLTREQADMGQQFGIACDVKSTRTYYDTNCVTNYWLDPTREGCIDAFDQDGNACQYCESPVGKLCLSNAQAQLLGVKCELDQDPNPFDTNCALSYFQNPTKEGCVVGIDQEGYNCEWCAINGGLNICLTHFQAERGGDVGLDLVCNQDESLETVQVKDPYDTNCIWAFLYNQSKEECVSAVDEDGYACQWCSLQGVTNICLTTEQAQMGAPLGIECDDVQGKAKTELPDDFWDCLQNYDEDGCAGNSCTWCNTQVGMGFCLASAAADAVKECTFFDCEYSSIQKNNVKDPFDPACLAAGMGSNDAEQDCAATMDSQGNPCIWCDAAGVFGLCLSSEQAAAAGQYLQCDSNQFVATK